MKIKITITSQTLDFIDNQGKLVRRYPVSTARNGAGQKNGSLCTPLGRHVVRAKIGEGQPENTVFVGRRLTGERYTPALGAQFPRRDWILSRILWLSGCEVGHNRLGDVDTMRRHIYIHGCPDTVPMGMPGSHGCIRMRNPDVIDLFDRVAPGTMVEISM